MNDTFRAAAFGLLLLGPVAAQAQTAPAALSATAMKVGERAPAFKGKDANGQEVELSKLLKKGPVVLYFYRGQWCPYCNKQLSQLQDSLQLLTARGAQVVVVSPETQQNIDKTVAKTKASFPIIHDQSFAIMKAYGTAFTVDEATARKYQGFGLDLKQANGAQANVLPVPATYVIGQDGRIRFAYFNSDYRQRVTVKQVLQAL
ncbi:alkyl hydroperoxide reductase/ Thiol specific antioxidant/ Mal allergen [Hymenobacter roseosalivarius DSM 11622]|uniref:thioredoxin-dependent peroxiredoxin n=1 Tax=Hymenobacter roseosalivarius DSM 11622 TaxID=645990 RepID=A0A1W1V1G8_9BACT|nr:peroxiredoxin-like family protein [Hymenobacter roseosalivarius]SMB87209.1 alkyl hydroperoxide reductase/ Thiol specific antioxidant/ Mal allergen [Hymenobacter roseosalivarius DSM 11622]